MRAPCRCSIWIPGYIPGQFSHWWHRSHAGREEGTLPVWLSAALLACEQQYVHGNKSSCAEIDLIRWSLGCILLWVLEMERSKPLTFPTIRSIQSLPPGLCLTGPINALPSEGGIKDMRAPLVLQLSLRGFCLAWLQASPEGTFRNRAISKTENI